MTRLRSQARELLASARLEHAPTKAERARLIRSLLDTAVQTESHIDQPAPLASRLSPTAKLLVLSALVLFIVGAIYFAARAGQP